MEYVSTRGGATPLGFADVLLEGLATDGGLFVPAQWPKLHDAALAGASTYAEAAVSIMWPFVEADFEREVFERIVNDAYATFEPPKGSTPDVVPLTEIADNTFIAELFWGPTFAFKDIALQLVGRLFDEVLASRGERVTIVGATSGDTGSAAIEACRDRDNIDIFILHPAGRTSEVQRRQMTTVTAANVFNLAVDGTFDDCQDLVKALFADEAFRRSQSLSAVNSINWARVMAQIVYYVTSAAAANRRCGRERKDPVSFCVPTGNFGNIFAGYGAMRMGLPVDQLLVGSNSNDILTRFFTTGTMEKRTVVPTLSPSMDIQISSNLERLLFEMSGRDGSSIAELMLQFKEQGEVAVADAELGWMAERFGAASIDDAECLAVIGQLEAEHGLVVDPHTAVGVAAARLLRSDPEVPMICLGTAHPAKFPDAVKAATGSTPEPPGRLAEVMTLEEHYDQIAANEAELKAYVVEHSGA